MLGLRLLLLFHLLSLLPLNLQQGLGDGGLFCHPPPARGLRLRLLGLLQRLLLLQLQELLLLAPALWGRDTIQLGRTLWEDTELKLPPHAERRANPPPQ